MTTAAALHFEDMQPGRRFAAPHWEVTGADIHRFATEFDPQPFHLDAEAARTSAFGGIVASGWHTAAMMMGMATRSELRLANGLVGLSVENLRFNRPVRPGDRLELEIEIVSARRSTSRPGFGVVRMNWTARNQHGETVAEATPNVWVAARRPKAATPGRQPESGDHAP